MLNFAPVKINTILNVIGSRAEVFHWAKNVRNDFWAEFWSVALVGKNWNIRELRKFGMEKWILDFWGSCQVVKFWHFWKSYIFENFGLGRENLQWGREISRWEIAKFLNIRLTSVQETEDVEIQDVQDPGPVPRLWPSPGLEPGARAQGPGSGANSCSKNTVREQRASNV